MRRVDAWPEMPDGSHFNGLNLFPLILNGENPFDWNVYQLIQEIENNLHSRVTDIPLATCGSHYYGFHFKLLDGKIPDIVVRLSRYDVNKPGVSDRQIKRYHSDVSFEAALYRLLRDKPGIRLAHLIYFHPAKTGTITQLAHVRAAALFRYTPPLDFCLIWLHERLTKPKPDSFSVPIAPTREFWISVLESKIRTVIGNEGDIIGWGDERETVGPVALEAKQALLRALPYIMPAENTNPEASLYRFVIDHNDFGIHNATATIDEEGEIVVTSLFDWECADIVPALLSNPELSVTSSVIMKPNEDGNATVAMMSQSFDLRDQRFYHMCSWYYLRKLYGKAPEYEGAIKAGKHMRYLWNSLASGPGRDPEESCNMLREWAEERISESLPLPAEERAKRLKFR
ncbi:hypothetical protein DID88_010459 [Monilinia fructigena]|uniref:Uncharacterized protein n=1 Tax=Monilinia fructigena TaxID=38457 RepID=A0A395ILG7_9HELO|nr:hypothetical protein DID88_010459 [Monilinia fructigena]